VRRKGVVARPKGAGVAAARARQIILALPGVKPGRSYGYPCFMLNGNFLARFRDEDTVLVLQLASIADREVLMQLDPRAFFFTDHYRDYPAVLIRLAEIPRALLRHVLAESSEVVAAKPSKPRTKSRRRL
jgi:hypothetical protein